MNGGQRRFGSARATPASRARSIGRNFGRPTWRRRTFNWCRRTRISTSLEPSVPERSSNRASNRVMSESKKSIRACYGIAGRNANHGFRPLQARALAADRPPLSFLLPIRVAEEIGMARVCASRLNPGRRPVRPPFEPRQPTLPGTGSMFGSALNSKPPRDRVLAPNSFRLSALSTPRARRALAPVGRSIRS